MKQQCRMVRAGDVLRCVQCGREVKTHYEPHQVHLTCKAEAAPCVYFGPLIELRPCDTCQGVVKIKVFECSHLAHNETTVQACETCADYCP